jgi:hypothetical protein
MRTLEELFERDIGRFLDERMGNKVDRKKLPRPEEENMFDLQKDYVKEVEAALIKDDLNKAKKIFDDLKILYGKLKYSDMDKARIFRMMDTAHMKIKTYLIEKHKEKNIYQDLQDFEAQTSVVPEKRLESVTVEQHMDSVRLLIEKKDFANAKEEAKLLVQSYNSLDPSQRKPEMYEQIRTLLMQLS